MKKIFIKTLSTKFFHKSLFATSLLFIFTIVSCQEDLQEYPKSIAVETFYNTPVEVETAVNAIYQPLRSTDIMGSYIPELEPFVDYGVANGAAAVLNDFSGLNATHIAKTANAWEAFYLSIRNANLVIANAPNGTDISENKVKEFVAEAKFLRAFNYFHLVRSWGGVPLRTEENMKVVELKRSSPEEVYNLIISDLLYAEANIPINPSPVGRPTKWSVKTLLADVYLQVGKYPEARDKSDEVIKSGKYSLVPVATADDWQKIFGSGAGITSEEVFYVQNMRQAGYGNIWPRYLNHPSTKLYQGGWFTFSSFTTNMVYQNQSNDDLRKALWYKVNIGQGPNSILNKKFIDPGTANAGNPATWYRYAEVLMIYAEAATRANNGPTAGAVEALNQVHRRAYGKNPKAAAPAIDFKLSDYNKDTFLDLIIKEYGYEFQYEGKRWLELKRTGKAQEIIMATKGITIAERTYLFPIPSAELNFNKALDPVKDQNPGY